MASRSPTQRYSAAVARYSSHDDDDRNDDDDADVSGGGDDARDERSGSSRAGGSGGIPLSPVSPSIPLLNSALDGSGSPSAAASLSGLIGSDRLSAQNNSGGMNAAGGGGGGGGGRDIPQQLALPPRSCIDLCRKFVTLTLVMAFFALILVKLHLTKAVLPSSHVPEKFIEGDTTYDMNACLAAVRRQIQDYNSAHRIVSLADMHRGLSGRTDLLSAPRPPGAPLAITTPHPPLESLTSVEGTDPFAAEFPFHVLWSETQKPTLCQTCLPCIHKLATLIKSYLATQNLQRTSLIVWADSLATANKLRHNTPQLSRLLPYFHIRVYDSSMGDGTFMEKSPLFDIEDPLCYLQGDLFRLMVLYRYGGVYVDADSVLLNDFGPLLTKQFLSRWGCKSDIMNAIIYIKKGGKLADVFLRELARTFPRPNSVAWGTEMLTRVYRGKSNPYIFTLTDPATAAATALLSDPHAKKTLTRGLITATNPGDFPLKPGQKAPANDDFCAEYDCIIHPACWFYPEWCSNGYDDMFDRKFMPTPYAKHTSSRDSSSYYPPMFLDVYAYHWHGGGGRRFEQRVERGSKFDVIMRLIDDKLRLRFGLHGEEVASNGGFNPYAPARRCVSDSNLDSVEYISTGLTALPALIALLVLYDAAGMIRRGYTASVRKYRQWEKRTSLVRYGLIALIITVPSLILVQHLFRRHERVCGEHDGEYTIALSKLVLPEPLFGAPLESEAMQPIITSRSITDRRARFVSDPFFLVIRNPGLGRAGALADAQAAAAPTTAPLSITPSTTDSSDSTPLSAASPKRSLLSTRTYTTSTTTTTTTNAAPATNTATSAIRGRSRGRTTPAATPPPARPIPEPSEAAIASSLAIAAARHEQALNSTAAAELRAAAALAALAAAESVSERELKELEEQQKLLHYYLFFEIFQDNVDDEPSGVIGLARSKDGHHWSYDRVVLEEPFHLAYPYVFEADGVYYMMPETAQLNEIRLYQALDFPYNWVKAATILSGDAYVDSSVLRYGSAWYLLTCVANRNLYLYTSSHLLRGWSEHPASPIVMNNRRFARPAGRIIDTSRPVLGAVNGTSSGDASDGRLFRFAMDNERKFGERVWAFEITTLDRTRYDEVLVGGSVTPYRKSDGSSIDDDRIQPVLAGSGNGWNANNMHHIDAQQLTADGTWIASVDGCTFDTRKPKPEFDEPLEVAN